MSQTSRSHPNYFIRPDRRRRGGARRTPRGHRPEAPDDERRGPGGQPGDLRLPLPEALDEPLHEASLDRDVQRADDGQREADLDGPPSVPIAGVEDEDARKDLEPEELDEIDRSEAEQVAVGAEQFERTGRVRAPPRERLSVLPWKGFREDEEPVRRAREREGSGKPE